MNGDLVLMALLAGAANWAFRAVPTLLMRQQPRADGLMARFLASTGPAAIATLFVASILPQLSLDTALPLELVLGVAATTLAFLPRRSVIMATMAGALAYGLTVALMA